MKYQLNLDMIYQLVAHDDLLNYIELQLYDEY